MDMKIFIDRLTVVMKEKNVTQNKLAKLTDKSPSLICKFLSGERMPSEKDIINIAYNLNVNHQYLMGLSENKDDTETTTDLYGKILDEKMDKERNMPIWAKRLNMLLAERNLKKYTLSEILNIHKSTVSSYTRGIREPDISSFIKIADYFNVSLDYLTGRTEIREYSKIDSKHKVIIDILSNFENELANYDGDNIHKFMKLLEKTYEFYKVIENI